MQLWIKNVISSETSIWISPKIMVKMNQNLSIQIHRDWITPGQLSPRMVFKFRSYKWCFRNMMNRSEHQFENQPQAFNARQLCLKSVFCFSLFNKLYTLFKLLLTKSFTIRLKTQELFLWILSQIFDKYPLSFLPCSYLASFYSLWHIFIVNKACRKYHQIE